MTAPKLIIEICPNEPRASACLMNGEAVSSDPDVARDLADCTRSGDCGPACEYVLEHIGVEFRIGNRIATPAEKEATARCIYFESESDFSDERTVESYLVWEAAHNVEDEDE